MTRKQIISGVALRMDGCAEAIRSKFAFEGYETQKLRISGQNGMLVQIRNTGDGASGIFKTTMGFAACATLKLAAQGDDVEVEVFGGKWLDKAVLNVVSWFVLWPLLVTSSIGMWRQKALLDRVFLEALSYFASSTK